MSDKLKIREHLRRIEAKEYLIPNFQREFIWKKARIIKLLESVLQNKPVGGLFFINNKSCIRHYQIDTRY